MEAKHKGIINRILPVIEELRDQAGFRISESLLHHVLDLAEENPKK
jgi:predicted nucleic acid-binding protein